MAASNDPKVKDVKAFDKRNGRPKTREETSVQLFHTAQSGLFNPELAKPAQTAGSNWENKVRDVRIDPTIALVRQLAIDPIVAAEWSVGAKSNAPAGAQEFIEEQIQVIRSYYMEQALAGCIDFGWQVFEKVFAIRDDGKIVIDKIKPLLQIVSTLLVSQRTGEYIGIVQNVSNQTMSLKVRRIEDDVVTGSHFLKAHESILTNVNVEGTNWYGRPIAKNAETAYDSQLQVNAAADTYDKKVAGSHWVIHYPAGSNLYNGVDTDNSLIAKYLVNTLEASGAIAVPKTVARTIEDMNLVKGQDPPNAWKIELLSDQTNQQENFIDRSKYLDSLKSRAFYFPERSILEGKFGTKAEASQHADFAIVILECRHDRFMNFLNPQLVNQLLLWNYGKEAVGTVFAKAAPIADNRRAFLRDVFMELLSSRTEVALKGVSSNEIKERLGLPLGADDFEKDFDELAEKNKERFGTENNFNQEGNNEPNTSPFGRGKEKPGSSESTDNEQGNSDDDNERDED